MEECRTVAHKALTELNACSKEVSHQQILLEAKICEHTRKIHEAAEARKVELIGKLRNITEGKKRDLSLQGVEIDTTIAQLSSFLETVHRSLAAGSQGEVVSMTATLGKQAEEIVESFQPSMLMLNVCADTDFVAKESLIKTLQSFGELKLIPIDPALCYATGDVEKVSVNEKSTVVIHAMDIANMQYKMSLPSLKGKLVSDLTGKAAKGSIERTGQNLHKITHQPIIKGRHRLHIKILGQHIRGSPFPVVVAKATF